MANGDVEIGYIGLGSMGLGAPATYVDFTSTQAASRLHSDANVVYP